MLEKKIEVAGRKFDPVALGKKTSVEIRAYYADLEQTVNTSEDEDIVLMATVRLGIANRHKQLLIARAEQREIEQKVAAMETLYQQTQEKHPRSGAALQAKRKEKEEVLQRLHQEEDQLDSIYTQDLAATRKASHDLAELQKELLKATYSVEAAETGKTLQQVITEHEQADKEAKTREQQAVLLERQQKVSSDLRNHATQVMQEKEEAFPETRRVISVGVTKTDLTK